MRKPMPFPYERYETLAEPITIYYPAGEDMLARWIFQTLDKASHLLANLLNLPIPDLEVLLVAPSDWELVPREEDEEVGDPLPYWTDVTSPPSLVIPVELAAVYGTPTQKKLAFILYHELALAFLESDPRPWPNENPLWADEWQLKFAALWLAHQIDGEQGMVNKDLREIYAELFEPEEDGKTPETIRSFDWYEDTSPEAYLGYELYLEQFAADLLARYNSNILPRFLSLYRVQRDELLSEDVTAILASVLDPAGAEWLENLVYF
ncbi:MAG: hypothetical protein M3Z24_06040 [Chloroflexota bacterium]|nr:hypothetical protein [Chloroflexota bacterium]